MRYECLIQWHLCHLGQEGKCLERTTLKCIMEGEWLRRVADQHPPHLRLAMLLLDSDLLYLPLQILLKILSNHLIQYLKHHNEFLTS